jgi:hypothetical protein
MRDCNSATVAVGFEVFVAGVGDALGEAVGEGEGLAAGTGDGTGVGVGDAVVAVALRSRCGCCCCPVVNGKAD